MDNIFINSDESFSYIDDILDIIVFPSFDTCIKTQIEHQLKEKLKKQLIEYISTHKMTNNDYLYLKKKIIHHYQKSLLSPGESIGIVSSQSLGSSQTQSTLNTFHSTGLTIASVVTGIPRFKELMSATRDPKGVVSYLTPRISQYTINSLREYICDSLQKVTFFQLLESIDQYDIDLPIDEKKAIDIFYSLHKIIQNNNNDNQQPLAFFYSTKSLPGIILKCNKKIVYKFRMNLYMIPSKIWNFYYNHYEFFKKNKILKMLKDDIDIICGPFNTFCIYIIPKTLPVLESWEIYNKQIIDIFIPEMYNYLISGIENIEHINFYKSKNDNTFKIITDGTNFSQLLVYDKIINSQVKSSNVWDIYTHLGIEATREFLIEEFMETVNSDGNFIHKQHIELMVDTMLRMGNINSVSRFGTRDVNSPFARSSFEEVIENFLKASVFGEIEKTKSISSSIMLGKVPKIGTGYMDLKYKLDSCDGDNKNIEYISIN